MRFASFAEFNVGASVFACDLLGVVALTNDVEELARQLARKFTLVKLARRLEFVPPR